MRSLFFLLLAVGFLIGCSSCGNRVDEQIGRKLLFWDSMVDSVPQLVADSLRTVDPENLDRPGRAYYGLLKVISDDKTYVNFTSDSLINSVTDYYRSHDPKSSNYIRSLAYEGIVRTRMGIKDSTVYEPLREAGRLLASMPDPSPSLGYMVSYFLGNINYNNRNYASADEYFRQTLDYARKEKDSVHLFDTYLAIYWNEMVQEKFGKGYSFKFL